MKHPTSYRSVAINGLLICYREAGPKDAPAILLLHGLPSSSRMFELACRTIEGYEAMHAIRKGQVRWVAKGDPIAQRQFIHTIFGVAA